MKTKAVTHYPFVPSGPQFKLALAFLAELGFETTWENGGLAGLRYGGAYFILQNIDVPQWQSNQMITFEVEDSTCSISRGSFGRPLSLATSPRIART